MISARPPDLPDPPGSQDKINPNVLEPGCFYYKHGTSLLLLESYLKGPVRGEGYRVPYVCPELDIRIYLKTLISS